MLKSAPASVASKFSDAEVEQWNKDMKLKIDRMEKEQKKRNVTSIKAEESGGK